MREKTGRPLACALHWQEMKWTVALAFALICVSAAWAEQARERLMYVPGPEFDGPPIVETAHEITMSCVELRALIERHSLTMQELQTQFGDLTEDSTRDSPTARRAIGSQIDDEFRASVRARIIAQRHGCDATN